MISKMEHFGYKGACGMCGHMSIETFKEELVWATDKWLQVINT